MSLYDDIQNIAIEEGYITSSEWVSEVINNRGWTVEQTAQYIALNYKRYYSWQHVYGVCRKLLAFSLLPARIRKYNLLAQKLGYSSAVAMFKEAIRKKKSCVEIASILGKRPCKIRNLINSGKVPKRRRKKKSKSGFLQPVAEKRWQKKAEQMGFKNVKGMLNKWPGTAKQLAQVLGVTEQTICLIKKRNR